MYKRFREIEIGKSFQYDGKTYIKTDKEWAKYTSKDKKSYESKQFAWSDLVTPMSYFGIKD